MSEIVPESPRPTFIVSIFDSGNMLIQRMCLITTGKLSLKMYLKLPQIVPKTVPETVPDFVSEMVLKFSSKISLKLSLKLPQMVLNGSFMVHTLSSLD